MHGIVRISVFYCCGRILELETSSFSFLKETVYLSYSMYGVVIFIVLSSPVVPNLETPCLEGTDLPYLVICSDI